MERVVTVEDRPADWTAVLPRLAASRAVYAPALPGLTGTVARAEVSAEGYARFVGRFLDALGVKRPVLVGHSLGGWWGCCSPRRLLVEWLRYA
jgi:pimeloyl-ACP methyl ester carboxylesterase